MKKAIKDLKIAIELLTLEEFSEIKSEMNELVSVYHKKIFALQKLLDKREYESKLKRISELGNKFNYKEPEFPSFCEIEDGLNVTGLPGHCFLESKEETEEFLKLKSSYDYSYVLEWSGAGEYKVIPSYEQDHDGMYIYTATFKRKESV